MRYGTKAASAPAGGPPLLAKVRPLGRSKLAQKEMRPPQLGDQVGGLKEAVALKVEAFWPDDVRDSSRGLMVWH